MKFHKKYRSTYWSIVVSEFFYGKKERVKYYSISELFASLDEKSPWLDRVLDKLQNIVYFPSDLLYSVNIYFKNKKGNTHVLDGGLEKGVWYDLDYRISQCLFYELDKYITQEKGIENHQAEMKLVIDENMFVDKSHEDYGKLTSQALAAIEQDEIWNWWKANKDYHDRDFVSLEQDNDYYEQETEMLIRLIKIRRSLWT